MAISFTAPGGIPGSTDAAAAALAAGTILEGDSARPPGRWPGPQDLSRRWAANIAALTTAAAANTATGVALGYTIDEYNSEVGCDLKSIGTQEIDVGVGNTALQVTSGESIFHGNVYVGPNGADNGNIYSSQLLATQGISADNGAITLGNPDLTTYANGINIGGGAVAGAGSAALQPMTGDVHRRSASETARWRCRSMRRRSGRGAGQRRPTRPRSARNADVDPQRGRRLLRRRHVALSTAAQARSRSATSTTPTATARSPSAIPIPRSGRARSRSARTTERSVRARLRPATRIRRWAWARSRPATSNGAYAQGAVAAGNNNTATDLGGVAIGDSNGAYQQGAVAVGERNTANGLGAVATGNMNGAYDQGAVASGNTNTATDLGATAIGDAQRRVPAGRARAGNAIRRTGIGAIATGDAQRRYQQGAVAAGQTQYGASGHWRDRDRQSRTALTTKARWRRATATRRTASARSRPEI